LVRVNAIKHAVMTLALMLAFIGGVWFATSLRQPSTCAEVPHGVVCWHGVTQAQWGVR